MKVLESPKIHSRCACYTLVELEAPDFERVHDGSAWYTCPGCAQPVGVKLDAIAPGLQEKILANHNVVQSDEADTGHGDGGQVEG